jgi:GMP synthase (glutamine-hydrolysing)
MPRVLVVEHEESCPPARFGEWLECEGVDVDVVRPHLGVALPATTGSYDGAVILGGSMGATDDDEVAWLEPVKALARRLLDAGTPTLGICLGHQLLAVALGGRVDRNPRGQQVGLIGIGWTHHRDADPLFADIAADARGIFWNNDTVTDLPDDAVLLASTEHGEPQVVRFGSKMWGVQFHPEVDAGIVQVWIDEEDHTPERRAFYDDRLQQVASSESEQVETWRPLAARFAALLQDGRS